MITGYHIAIFILKGIHSFRRIKNTLIANRLLLNYLFQRISIIVIVYDYTSYIIVQIINLIHYMNIKAIEFL